MFHPRKDQDNLGTLAVVSRNHNLSDPQVRAHSRDGYGVYEWDVRSPKGLAMYRTIGETWAQMTEELHKKADAAVVLPVYKYEHSMIALSTESFIGRAHMAEWDSGLVGHIWVSKQQLRHEYGVQRITKRVIELATSVLKAEVEEYSDWLNSGEEE